MSEYVSLKVIERAQGKNKMRTFLKEALDGYLLQRTLERKRENALMYNDGQGYIHYQKGSMVLYALSDYIGEEKLNGAIQKFINKVKFQEPPYTTSIEFVNYLREATPDSLQYVIKDMFETITLYKNRITNTKVTELENGTYQVDIEFEGIMKEKLLYLKKHKVTSINNKLTIIVNEKPIEVGVDPYNKLIDSQSDDNRKKI